MSKDPAPIEPIASIVVPAHNEEHVIAANLSLLLRDSTPGEFDVVVVPNACSDRTAEVARGCGVRVIETTVPGKVHALRLGDEACRAFPRVYLDADVEMTAASVRALARACAAPGVLACAPVPRLDTTNVGPVVRRVHRVHEALVAPDRALAGVGAYVLSRTGHERVFPMPDVISDDGWVHNCFAPDERVVVREAETVVRPARTVAAHLARRVRVRQGNQQLARLGHPAPQGRLGFGALASLVGRRQVSLLDAGCYLGVQLVDRVMTWRRRGHDSRWGSDLSSRSASRAAGSVAEP